MTKTTKSVDGQYGLVEMTVTAALIAAVASFTLTAEDVDVSLVVARIEEGSPPSREINQDPVIGDKTKIISPATSIDAADYTIYFYYTQGKETVGTDLFDPVTALREVHKLVIPLPIQFHWSIGGAVGDEKESTDPNDTYIQSVGSAIPGEAGRKLIPVHIMTADTTVSTIA